MYYKEEELNRFWEVENNVCGCVMKEEKHSLETFDLSDRGNYYIGLCTNSQTLFCRIEKKEEGHRYLGNLNPCSLIFAKDGKEERYNTLFPKVAWGITAWLLFHYQYDSDLEELYNEDDSRDDIFARYKDLCYTIHKARYAKRYNHYSKNNPKKIDELDELFITTHIQQEREYISKFSHHECMTEEYYKAILQCANEYIQWVEDSKEKASANVVYTNVNYNIIEETNSSRKKGRQKKSLSAYMINDDNGEKLQKLHQVMKGKIGKSAALIILAAISKGWMEKPTYTQVKDEFGDIGTQQGFTAYLSPQKFSSEEIDGAINSLD